MYLLSFVYLLWRNVYSSPLLIFKLGSVFIVALYELFILYSGCSSLIRYMTCKYFLPLSRLPFHFADDFFFFFLPYRKLFGFMQSHLFSFTSIFGIKCKKKLWPSLMSRNFPTKLSWSFMVSSLIFKSLIHFHLIFVYNVRE